MSQNYRASLFFLCDWDACLPHNNSHIQTQPSPIPRNLSLYLRNGSLIKKFKLNLKRKFESCENLKMHIHYKCSKRSLLYTIYQ